MGMFGRGFFARDGAGVDILGGIADGVLAVNGAAPVYGPAQDQRRQLAYAEQQYQRRRADQLADAAIARNAPDFFQNKAGDYVRYDPVSGEAKVVYDGPAAPVQPTALEQQVRLYRSLNPQATDAEVAEIVKRGIAGAQYDPRVYQPMTDYKAAAARATKMAPTYAAMHPKASGGGRAKVAPKLPTGFILD